MAIKNNSYLSKSLLNEERDRKNVEQAMTLIEKIRKRPTYSFAVFALVLAFTQMLSKIGLISPSFVTAIGTTIIFCIVGLGFCLLLGYSALASLGTAGFIGIGAYSAYYCIAEWGLTIGIALIVAIVAALVIGIVVGYISLRIEGIYLAIVTLGIAQIIKEILSALCDTIKLKGSQLTLFGIESMKLKTDHVFYILVGVLFLLMVITQNLMNSPTGRAMLAMKNSTSAAQAFGISLLKYRLLAFTISIIYASVAGLLYMLYVRYVSNSSSTLFTLSTSLNILGAVIIGGTKSIWGTIGGTFIIYGIDQMFLQDIDFFRENPTLITLFCGILVVIVVMFYPGGLTQLVLELKLKLQKLRAKRREARYGKDLG
jgi:branched-chain amino acid transport system permease protein